MRFTLKAARCIRELVQTALSERLDEAVIECETLTKLNCAWLEYELKDIMLDVLTREIQLQDDIRLRLEREPLRPVLGE